MNPRRRRHARNRRSRRRLQAVFYQAVQAYQRTFTADVFGPSFAFRDLVPASVRLPVEVP